MDQKIQAIPVTESDIEEVERAMGNGGQPSPAQARGQNGGAPEPTAEEKRLAEDLEKLGCSKAEALAIARAGGNCWGPEVPPLLPDAVGGAVAAMKACGWNGWGGVTRFWALTAHCIREAVESAPFGNDDGSMERAIGTWTVLEYADECGRLGLLPFDGTCLFPRFTGDGFSPALKMRGYETIIMRSPGAKSVRYARSSRYVKVPVPYIENRLILEDPSGEGVLKLGQREIEVPDQICCRIECAGGTCVEGNAYASDIEGEARLNECWAKYPERMYERIAFRRAASFFCSGLCPQSADAASARQDPGEAEAFKDRQRFRADVLSAKIAKEDDPDALREMRAALESDAASFGPHAKALAGQLDARLEWAEGRNAAGGAAKAADPAPRCPDMDLLNPARRDEILDPNGPVADLAAFAADRGATA